MAAAPMPAVATVSTLDKALAIVAVIVGLVAVGSTAYVIWMLPN
jgi:hypothetical protein